MSNNMGQEKLVLQKKATTFLTDDGKTLLPEGTVKGSYGSVFHICVESTSGEVTIYSNLNPSQIFKKVHTFSSKMIDIIVKLRTDKRI